MNKQKVIKAIAMERARKAGKLPPHNCSPDSEIDWMVNAVEALEEIASDVNIKALQGALPAMVSPGYNSQLAKLLAALIAIQVPKEVVYAYPMTMERHFQHYSKVWCSASGRRFDVEITKRIGFNDDFGCSWQSFTGPKELVDYLRENNVPIKVIE